MDIGYCYLCWWQIEKVKKSMPKYLYFLFVVGQGCVRAKASFSLQSDLCSHKWGPYLRGSDLEFCTLWLLSWNSWSFYFWIYFVSKFQLESGALLWFRSTGSEVTQPVAWFASSCLPRSDPFLSTPLPRFCCHPPSLTKARVWYVEGWGQGVHIPFLRWWGRALAIHCLHSYCCECPGSISVPKGVLHSIVMKRTSLMRTYCVA